MARRKTVLVVIGLILICIVTIIIGKKLGTDKTAVPVDAIRISSGPFSVSISAEGTIEPAETVEVRAGVTGKVAEFFVKEGDIVKAGQRLARLENLDLEAQLQQAKSQLAAAEADLIQFESEITTQSGKTFAVRQNETQLQAAKVRLQEVLKGPPEGEIAQVKAQFTQADIEMEDALRQLEVMEALYKEGAVSKSSVEDAKGRVKIVRAQLEAAKKQYKSLCDLPDKEQVELAEAQVKEAEIALSLAKEQEISKEKGREAAKARLAQANAALRIIESSIAMTMTTSPEDGIVTSIPVTAGAVVTEGTPIIIIAKAGGMRVKARVDETDIAGVKVGQPVKFSTDAIWDAEFSGTVSKISPQAVYSNLIPGFTVLIDINDPRTDLRPGMSADVEIITYFKEDALTVPIQTIIEDSGKEAIFTVNEDDSTAFITQVTTGLTDAINIEILEGIKEGDLVITGDYDALHTLCDGRQIKLNNEK